MGGLWACCERPPHWGEPSLGRPSPRESSDPHPAGCAQPGQAQPPGSPRTHTLLQALELHSGLPGEDAPGGGLSAGPVVLRGADRLTGGWSFLCWPGPVASAAVAGFILFQGLASQQGAVCRGTFHQGLLLSPAGPGSGGGDWPSQARAGCGSLMAVGA